MTDELTPRQRLLLDSLSVAVPMRIAELMDDVPVVRWARIEEWRAAAVEPVASRGDVLMYGGKRGDAAEVFDHLAKGLAALAFAPGGVRFAGLHFVAPAD